MIIAVDGRSGAGKTTVAVELAALLRRHRSVSLFHLEDIYPGWDGLAGGVERYIDSVLAPLSLGMPATWTQWDWAAEHDGASRTTELAPVVIVEGVGSSHGGAGALLDATIWVDAPSQNRKERALERDGDTYAPFWDLWADQEELLLEGSRVPELADIVVDGTHGVANAPALVLDALTQLPAMENVLAPELARRRGLEFSATRLEGLPAAAELFHALYGTSEHAVWLDSSIAEVHTATGAARTAVADAISPAAAADAANVAGTDTASSIAADRSRFSIMADNCGHFGQLSRHEAGLTTVSCGQVTTHIRGPFFHWLDSVWGRKAVRAPDHYPGDFTLGWLGYLGYELKAETGGTPTSAHRSAPGSNGTPGVPDAALLFAGRALVLDHRENCLYVLTLTDVHHVESRREAQDFLAEARAAHASALARTARANPSSAPSLTPSNIPAPSDQALRNQALSDQALRIQAPVFTARDGERHYKDMIAAAQAQIHDGNSYEVCLTTALDAQTPNRLDPWSTYRALRTRNPAPFAAFLRLGGLSVASTSPERFLRIDSEGLMRAEPIKGTRRRDTDPATDAALKTDLLTSLKDRAENVMIVDLLRNDLSRFALPNSLSVPRLCAIESYATVHQMVSTIEAQLAPGNSRAQAVAAAFPAGSMTGAPKISTMAILDHLEAGPRGIYAGAIGYFSLNAATDLSVVIRTLVLQDTDDGGTHLSLGIGGAITADSEDAAEWDEIQAKAHGVLATLGSNFPG
ncbi:anthranilate synthase [Arthrobacter alpinus]|uniref:Anthranilate synthase n=1 Tax=Arthrobacter alpinus TaxID=656366 RepID=A0A0S2LVJ8_9MICC|nr:chorismate-binding protein [Arthrobacter alpinus]ALO65438.1 anthranilate synthase [Arthrobacter alpinus]